MDCKALVWIPVAFLLLLIFVTVSAVMTESDVCVQVPVTMTLYARIATWHVVTALSGIAVINLDFSFQWPIPLHGHASDWYHLACGDCTQWYCSYQLRFQFSVANSPSWACF